MNFKFSFVILIFLLSMAGCSGINAANEKPDHDRPIVESGSGETSEHTSLEPPNLTIYVGEETVRPILGTYSWSVEHEDGTATAVESDSLAPPELLKNSHPLQVTANTKVELNFEIQPDSYSVRIWDDDHNVKSNSDKVVLSGKGQVIYEVLAQWKQGTAIYVFSLDIVDEKN